jgi:hypothetical protein
MAGRERPIYRQLKVWVEQYGSAGVPDQRAVHTFIECENAETLQMLQNELIGISHGNYDEGSLEKLLKAQRKINFNSYEEWAKLMLLWIAGFKR